MSAKNNENEIKLPKVPTWLEKEISREKDVYNYFKNKDRLAERSTINLILRGSITGIML